MMKMVDQPERKMREAMESAQKGQRVTIDERVGFHEHDLSDGVADGLNLARALLRQPSSHLRIIVSFTANHATPSHKREEKAPQKAQKKEEDRIQLFNSFIFFLALIEKSVQRAELMERTKATTHFVSSSSIRFTRGDGFFSSLVFRQ